MSHVLAIHLGPVQEFLAAARRTRDLWFGSWLLSELARAAGLAIETRTPRSLIFPAAGWLHDPDATFANKLLARVPDDPEGIAGAAIAAIGRRLEELRVAAFEPIEKRKLTEGEFHHTAALAQIEDLIEIQWASAPEVGGPTGYAAARRAAERSLGARKNTRDWEPTTKWAAPVPKSAIDGLRESVIDESLFDRKSGWGAEKLYRVFRVGPTERLDGVSLLKRLGLRQNHPLDHHFLSTGHVAAWPLMARIEKLARDAEVRPRLEAGWKALPEAMAGAGITLADHEVYLTREHPILGRFDGSLLFEARLADLFREQTVEDGAGGWRPLGSAERRGKAQPPREKLAAFLRVADLPAPLPYYAILHADGDRMGAAIGEIEDLERHKDLSRQLTEFAGRAREIVETKHRGELVYAGGDDVLAFVPLQAAIECARELAEAFFELVAEFPDGEGHTPTLSVGLGIAHFLAPLSRTLDLARGAERDAKGVPGKNALALRIDKRSGPTLSLSGRWGTLDADLQTLAGLHAQDEISDKGGFDLRQLARLLEGTKGEDRGRLEAMAKKETVRILARKQPQHGAAPGHSDEVKATLREMLDRSDSIAAFADRLIAARLFGEALVQSGRGVPPETPGKHP